MGSKIIDFDTISSIETLAMKARGLAGRQLCRCAFAFARCSCFRAASCRRRASASFAASAATMAAAL
jgi:hypothetical protein